LIFFIFNLAAFAVGVGLEFRLSIAFYVWLGIFSVMVLALFWAFAADLFNIKAGERIFPIVAAGAALGAYLGSLFTGWLDPIIGHHGVMIFAAAMLLIPWFLAPTTEASVPLYSRSCIAKDSKSEHNHIMEGFLVVFRNRYLILIAVFIVLLNLINTNGEYIISKLLESHTEELLASGEITDKGAFYTKFYSLYISWFTILGFLIQLFLVSRIFKWIGIRGAILILPVTMLINYSIIFFIPLLNFVRISMIAENSINYSVQNTTRHALFLPVNRDEKYVGKNTIDTFFYRFGDLLSAGVVFVGGMVALQTSGFIAMNFILAGALLFTGMKIGTFHKETVEENHTNTPPILTSLIPDIEIPCGEETRYTIKENTFVDPDEGDNLKYATTLTDGSELPEWVNFNTETLLFKFDPPAGSSGVLDICVRVADLGGLETKTSFKVSYGTF
jgi:ATP:ADP antiporter, AAA family